MDYASKLESPDEAAEELLAAESDANQCLDKIRKAYQVTKPHGVGLTKQLARDWSAYQRERERLEQEVFAPFTKDVANTLGKMAQEAQIYIDQRKRLKDIIDSVAASNESDVKTEASLVKQSASDTRRVAIDTARKAIYEFKDVVRSVKAEFSERDLTDTSPEQAEMIREGFVRQISDVGRKNTESLGRIREMLTSIAENMEQSADVDHLDVVESLDSELQSFKEQANTDAELVQLGLAVAVINHEFEAAIKGIHAKLRELGSWARLNDELVPLYRDIRMNYEHLDEHLNLFTPLQRRLYRKRISIKGSEISHYVKTLFSARFKRHEISLKVEPEFTESVIRGFPSVIYPVFVNVIDNAIFWLSNIQGERVITLGFAEGNYRIGNNGPPVHQRDNESIFEQGFSRKPSGRGLGLFISKKTLLKEGMDLVMGSPETSEFGVVFEIRNTEEIHDAVGSD